MAKPERSARATSRNERGAACPERRLASALVAERAPNTMVRVVFRGRPQRLTQASTSHAVERLQGRRELSRQARHCPRSRAPVGSCWISLVADRAGSHAGDQQDRGDARQPSRAACPACDGAPSRRRTRCSSEPPVAASASRPRAAAQLLEVGQRARVGVRIAAQADREIVAAVLALGANPPRQPPHRRVVEQQRLDQRLQQVDEIVVAADVRELVGEDRLELLRREPGQRARRQQHHRPQPADHRRHGHRVDSRSRTGRRMWSRRARARSPMPASGPRPARRGAASCRCTHSQPLTSRSDSTATPQSQTAAKRAAATADGLDGRGTREASSAPPARRCSGRWHRRAGRGRAGAATRRRRLATNRPAIRTCCSAAGAGAPHLHGGHDRQRQPSAPGRCVATT